MAGWVSDWLAGRLCGLWGVRFFFGCPWVHGRVQLSFSPLIMLFQIGEALGKPGKEGSVSLACDVTNPSVREWTVGG